MVSVDPNPLDDDLDPALAEVLAERGVACPGCGYNLRGLSTPDCPECGGRVTWDALLQRRPAVSLAWAVGLIGLSVSLPESYLKWQRFAYRRLFFYGEQRWTPNLNGPGHGGYTQPEVTMLNPLFVGSTLYWYLIPLVVVAWWALRERIAAWSGWLRWGVAIGWVGLAILGHRRQMFWYYDLGLDRYAPWPLWYID